MLRYILLFLLLISLIFNCGSGKRVGPDIWGNLYSGRDIFDEFVFYGKVMFKIDDFEDGDTISAMGYSWFTVDDGVNGGNSSISIDVKTNDGASGTGKALHITYTLGHTWGAKNEPPYAFVKTELTNINTGEKFLNFNNYDYIDFWMKGSGKKISVVLETPDVIKDYNYYNYTIDNVPAKWREYKIKVKDFSQGDWGPATVTVDMSQAFSKVVGIAFKASSAEEGDTGDIYVDQVSIINQGRANDYDNDLYYGN